MKRYEADDVTLEQFFDASVQYRIPQFQRPYSWTEDQAQDFWDDLQNESSSNFIGALILNNEHLKSTKEVEIIDGQQRVLTSMIFLAVLRDYAKSLSGGDELASRIQDYRIAKKDKRGKTKYLVVCGDTTRDFFEKYIQSGTEDIRLSDAKRSDEYSRVKEVYEFFWGRLGECLSPDEHSEQKLEKIERLWESLEQVGIVRITINSQADAFEIFETVNARGVELSVADLLKNLMFKEILGKEKQQAKVVQQKWLEIEKNVGDAGFEVSRFIRYYWLSKFSFIVEKRLFREVKSKIKDYSALLNDLQISSQEFNSIVERGDDALSDLYGADYQKIARSLMALDSMKTTQWLPIFMSITRNRKKINHSFVRLFSAIEAFSFQYFLVCKKPANKIEKLVSRYSVEIESICSSEANPEKRDKQIDSKINKFINALKLEAPTRSEFIEKFEKIEYRNSSSQRIALKYILSRVNSHLGSGETLIDFSQVNIEHIIPQNPGSEWEVSKKDLSSYVNKIGNLTLVHKKINSKAGNKGLEQKLKFLEASELPITKAFVSEATQEGYVFDKEKVNSRTGELAISAIDDIWSL